MFNYFQKKKCKKTVRDHILLQITKRTKNLLIMGLYVLNDLYVKCLYQALSSILRSRLVECREDGKYGWKMREDFKLNTKRRVHFRLTSSALFRIHLRLELVRYLIHLFYELIFFLKEIKVIGRCVDYGLIFDSGSRYCKKYNGNI